MGNNGKVNNRINAIELVLAGSILAVMVLGLCVLTSCSAYKNIQLTTACKDALRTNPNIDASKLVCNVKDGVAYVSGSVYTAEQRKLVVDILKGVPGITDVRETIEIEEGGEKNPTMLWF